MIRIEFTGDAMTVRQEMRALLGLDQEVGQSGNVVDLVDVGPQGTDGTPAPKPASRKKAQSTTGATSSADQSSAADDTGNTPASGAATTQLAAAPASATSDPAALRDVLRAKLASYGQPNKGGPAALQQLLVEHGSPQAKFSQVADDQLAALDARLDELLAG